ncbi:UPF0481 protein At3g47200-like [Rutidosis leptorrhynchoides]|uniref:UPF0481 protein At3g47200-like n=1 Tax=Rutidosis leptorrhynchoides TaxID=125765 RepID=UPI003A99A9B9
MATEMVPLLNNQENVDQTTISVDNELLSSVEARIREIPMLLNKSASKETCCIFRVPQSLIEINEKAYQPHIVSIGPYHHGKEHLRMIEEHKGRLVGNLLDRSRKVHGGGVSLEMLIVAVAGMEGRIRQCYSESIDKFNSHELIQMMVLDGCFVIELFCVVGKLVPGFSLYDDDPIFNMEWVFFYLVRDLLRLENQIPFFVLETLFELVCPSKGAETAPSLVSLALLYFNYASQILQRNKNLDPKHLLDLFRLSLLPETTRPSNNVNKKIPNHQQLIQSAKNLQLAGVGFKSIKFKTKSLLDIKFTNGMLEIPSLTIDDFTTSVFLNCVAFEQCYQYCSKHVTSYAVFMGCLINTPTDAGLLCERKIIENYFGTNEEVARFFHDVGKDVAFDIQRSYLLKLFEDVNKYCNNGWHVQWAGFKHTYFETPWSFISALAAIILLIFTFIQAFFAVYSYFLPPKGPKQH